LVPACGTSAFFEPATTNALSSPDGNSQKARTILVLEHNDVQTTNVSIVTDVYLRVMASRADAPDETYMVSTYTSPWYAWPILIDGQSYFDLATQSHFCIDANGHLINRK
jgi:hypothetical protein